MAGRTIAGRYRLGERLGTGGMASVWAAEDLELGRNVAVKLLAPEADPARFEREARTAASLTHPNVSRLFDFGESDGEPFMVFELLPGGSLEDRLGQGGGLADDEVARIAADIAAGLAAAHELGLVHRDLKPANVLFDSEGRAKIADFGIARGSGGTLTEPGTILGTAAYISPEQAAGHLATPTSDVYSFGVILYRMLTGRLPFEAAEPHVLVALHRTEPAPPIEAIRPDVPPRLAGVAMSALAKDTRERPPDGGALLAELEAPPAPGPADDATVAFAPGRPARRRARTALVIAALLLLAAAGGAVALVAADGSEGQPAAPPAGRTGQGARSATDGTSSAPPLAGTGQTATSASTSGTTTAGTTDSHGTAPSSTVPAGTTPIETAPPTDSVPTGEETTPPEETVPPEETTPPPTETGQTQTG